MNNNGSSISRIFCAVIAAGTLCSTSVALGQVSGTRFKPAQIPAQPAGKILPHSLDQTRVKVVAVLSGPSVANEQEAAGRRLSRAERLAIKAQRAAEQSGMDGQIQAAGGRIIGRFQSAVNGLEVTVPQNQLGRLRQIPGVVDVLRVGTYRASNSLSVPRVGAPVAWSGVAGVHGEHVKVAVIDSGIDYTHADFGGPGTPAAFTAASASSNLPADPAWFGPNAPKVKGGVDLVGDDYDPASGTPPQPDPNPLDCEGHGTHVAGTVAGLGVLNNGSTYTGTYDQLTPRDNEFAIGPGVAPLADLYAVRVLSCHNGTDVVIDAIEWAVDNDMDVINLSLGTIFTGGNTVDAKAVDDASRAGIVVVSSAGNIGDIPYALGAPASSNKGIAAAGGAKQALERRATLALPAVPALGLAAKTVQAVNVNSADWRSPAQLQALVLRTPTGAVSSGCDPQDYANAPVAGKIVVTQLIYYCSRNARATYAAQAGAAAIVFVNDSADYPPLDGPITFNPDTGEQYAVSIPYFGVRGLASTTTSDGFALLQRDGVVITVTEAPSMAPPIAYFSSSGPSTPNSRLKPDITAPAISIVSAFIGTGNGGVTFEGTSMAAPHIAGTAALVVQAHPKWKPAAVKSAIVNSGDPSAISNYAARRAGSGFVNAAVAVGTKAYAFADRDETAANFGLEEFASDLSRTQTIHVVNDAATPVTFKVTAEGNQGSPHTVALSAATITVGARSAASVDMTLTLPATTAGNADAFRDVAGIIAFTPAASSQNGGFVLRVPYYLVPRVSANVDASLALPKRSTSGVVTVTNQASPIPATADFYAWGLESKREGFGRSDIHAVGVQSYPSGSNAVLAFAVNTFKAWSTPETDEFDIFVDSSGDGVADFIVFNVDLGLLSVGWPSGQEVSAVYNIATNTIAVDFFATAPTDSSTIVLPVRASRLGITPAHPRFSYTAEGYDRITHAHDALEESATFNAFQSAISTGQFVNVAPNGAVAVPITVNAAEAQITPPKGVMIVTPDNKNGRAEATLLRAKL